MKANLLKQLRNQGRDNTKMHSMTKSNGRIIGVSFMCDGIEYERIFFFDEKSIERAKEEICRLWLISKIEYLKLLNCWTDELLKRWIVELLNQPKLKTRNSEPKTKIFQIIQIIQITNCLVFWL